MTASANYLEEASDRMAAARERLLAHPVYTALTSVDALRVFMSNHVFAVWDFMSLLKELQRRLTCVATPWVPSPNPFATRMINEIVLAEESDEIAPGEYLDHFRLYLAAMDEVGADIAPMRELLAAVRDGADLEAVLRDARVPRATRAFVQATFAVLERPTHELVAVFLYGRENLIPSMFALILDALDRGDARTPALRTYLNRHIVLDGEEHGPRATALLRAVCGDEPVKWREATDAALGALAARRALWDGVLAEIASRDADEPSAWA